MTDRAEPQQPSLTLFERYVLCAGIHIARVEHDDALTDHLDGLHKQLTADERARAQAIVPYLDTCKFELQDASPAPDLAQEAARVDQTSRILRYEDAMRQAIDCIAHLNDQKARFILEKHLEDRASPDERQVATKKAQEAAPVALSRVISLAESEEHEGSRHWVIRFPAYFGHSCQQSIVEYLSTIASPPAAPVANGTEGHSWDEMDAMARKFAASQQPVPADIARVFAKRWPELFSAATDTPASAVAEPVVTSETAWLIERDHEGRIEYAFESTLGVKPRQYPPIVWTNNPNIAKRFTSKVDARAFALSREVANGDAELSSKAVRFAEHEWPAPPPIARSADGPESYERRIARVGCRCSRPDARCCAGDRGESGGATCMCACPEESPRGALKLPERKISQSPESEVRTEYEVGRDDGWNECLDVITNEASGVAPVGSQQSGSGEAAVRTVSALNAAIGWLQGYCPEQAKHLIANLESALSVLAAQNWVSEAAVSCACPEHGNWYCAEDIDHMVLELDVLMYGDRAARHPLLCDIFRDLKDRIVTAQNLPAASGVAELRGFRDAFYEIAEMLDIPAQAASPKHVFETIIRPRLRELIARATPSHTAGVPNHPGKSWPSVESVGAENCRLMTCGRLVSADEHVDRPSKIPSSGLPVGE